VVREDIGDLLLDSNVTVGPGASDTNLLSIHSKTVHDLSLFGGFLAVEHNEGLAFAPNALLENDVEDVTGELEDPTEHLVHLLNLDPLGKVVDLKH